MTSLASPCIEYRRRPASHRSNDFITCDTPGCMARSSGQTSKHDGFSIAVYLVFILGRPVGGLCTRCAKDWQEAYGHALWGWPEGHRKARGMNAHIVLWLLAAINAAMTAINVPGALDGHPASIVGVAFCGACTGFVVGLAVKAR